MSDPIKRLNAALEGRYRIERELGEGGMATVYLADDLKHERKVALKVLKPELAAVVGAARFLAEIKTTANLQHPHVLPLFDSGEADTFLFYVMPYVEGETLRERIDRERQLPVDDAVRIATNMAEALDYAHRQGVIHRDIKPANVLMLDGKPIISDFGIALAVGAIGEGRLTETGLSPGTPHYMSPEQASGDQTVGPATDIYALGCVLYEMLVGEPPYTGSNAQIILGKIVAGKLAAASEQRPAVPPNVDATIRKALERLPADRFAGAQNFAEALADPGFTHGAVVGTGSNRSIRVLASAVVVLAVALAWALFRAQSGPTTTISRYNLNLESPELSSRYASRVAVSPDGSSFVFVGPRQDYQLWLRPRGELEPTPIAGTEGGFNPAFSPDGQRVAFLVGRPAVALRVVSLRGEPPVELIRGEPNRLGHSWAPDGYIYLGSDEGLVRVGEDGGSVESVTRTDSEAGETGHVTPTALPGGRGILFTVLGTPSSDVSRYQIAVADPSTGDYSVLVPGVRVRYSATGHLVYVSADGTLLAVPFDENQLEITGTPVSLADGVMVGELGSLDMDLSSNGTLVYRSSSSDRESELVYVARDGSARVIYPGWTDDFTTLALSPDGARLALEIQGPVRSDIWVKQLDRGSELRLSFDGTRNTRPEWTPDGQSVSYGSDRLALLDIWLRRADGGGDLQIVLDRERGVAEAFWSRDGRWLIYRTDAAAAGAGDILLLPSEATGDPTVLLASPYSEFAPALSPDGNWLAYISNETGSYEVYVVPFPDVGASKSRISVSGGTEPVWAHSGRELFYRNGEGEMVSVAVSTTPTFDQGDQRVLFSATPYRSLFAHRLYDVTPDDERFVMVRVITSGSTGDLVVVEGFFEELTRLVPN